MNVAAPQFRGRNTAVDGSGDLVITNDQAFTAGRVAVVDVQVRHDNSTTPAAPTSVSGGGVTFQLETTYAWDSAGTQRSGLFRYCGAVSAPSGTTITIVPAAAFGAIQAICYELVDVDTGSNGTAAFGATKWPATAGTANLIEVACLTLQAAQNAYLAVAVCSNGTAARTWTPDASPAMTELPSGDYATAVAASGKYSAMEISYRLQGGDTNPTIGATTSASIDLNGILVVELIGAPDGPTVTSLDVEEGPAAGGTAVTITGSGFDASGGSSEGVTFGGSAATSVIFVNATTITCVTPAHAGGAVDVVVTNGNGTFDTLPNGFFYEGTVVIVNPSPTDAGGDSSPDGSATSTLWAPTGLAKRVKMTPTIGGVTCTPRCIKLVEP